MRSAADTADTMKSGSTIALQWTTTERTATMKIEIKPIIRFNVICGHCGLIAADCSTEAFANAERRRHRRHHEDDHGKDSDDA